MNITYVLGNGFDLHNGLRTSYSNFYSYLKKVVKQDNCIFQDIQGNYGNWSDFEDQLGHYINNADVNKISAIKIEEDFVEILEHLIEYMKVINEEYISNLEIKQFALEGFILQMFNLQKNLEEFSNKNQKYFNIVRQVAEYSESIMPKSSNFNIISLNYTTYLDDYYLPTRSEELFRNTGGAITVYYQYFKPLHIHGNVLLNNVLLGLETDRELPDDFSSISDMIKKRAHASYIHKGIPDLINSTSVIKETDIFVFFGVSFGKTDEDLIKEIYDENPNAYFIIHVYSENDSPFKKQKKENEAVEAIFNLIGIHQKEIKESDNFIFLTEAEAIFGNVSLPRAQ